MVTRRVMSCSSAALEGAEQEGEACGRVECRPDLAVCVSGEPGLGDAQVRRVVLIRDELEVDRGGMRWVVSVPGEADAPVGLDLLDPHPPRGAVHLPFPGELGTFGHSPRAFGVPESRGKWPKVLSS